MSKFIEVTDEDGEKRTINISEINYIRRGDGEFRKTFICNREEYNFFYAQETYEEIKAMLMGDNTIETVIRKDKKCL